MSIEVTWPDGKSNSNERGPFLPLLLGLIAFLGWTAFQTTELINERAALSQAHAEQVAMLDQAQKLRAAMDSLTQKTQKLADAGDGSAQFVMAQV